MRRSACGEKEWIDIITTIREELKIGSGPPSIKTKHGWLLIYHGDVDNVVFPTGACVIDEKLHVYYGGADKVCCLAVVELNDLLQYILDEN